MPSISALIEPLVAEGTLVERPADVLTCDVEDGFYYVYMRDNVLLACAHLKRFSETHAEIGCFVVSKTYRRQGCGDAMLSFVERTAAAAGVGIAVFLSGGMGGLTQTLDGLFPAVSQPIVL